MKKIYLYIALAIFLLLPSCKTVVAAPDYDLLIIAPSEFVDELVPLQEWKAATGRPSMIVSLEYAESHYPGWDSAEKVKHCIADYEATHNVKYVLLVGDVDHLPMRYFYLKRENTTHVNWLQYYLTDHYYADLYKSDGSFCSWDDDGDRIYGEIYDFDDDGVYDNFDGIDFNFDVVVGRIPVDTGAEVTTYVNKVIKYEKEVYDTDPWFKKILLVTGTGEWVYPEDPDTYDEDENDDIATTMAADGYTAIKLYHTNPDDGLTYPNSANINTNLNSGVGFMNVISHGNENSWGVYTLPGNMAGLMNNDKLPIVYSFGCSTAKLGPIAPADPYISTGGTRIVNPITYPVEHADWDEPVMPSPLQDSTTDINCMPEYWNFRGGTGAIAFIGSTAEASSALGYPVMQAFYQSLVDASGPLVLGDIWDDVSADMISGYSLDTQWDKSRRWLYMNVFGDPSLVIGGLSDKPPVTTLSIGASKETVSGDIYVSDLTDFTLSAIDDGSVSNTFYRYYKGSTSPAFVTYTSPFSLLGEDGVYTLEYYSVDDSGNKEYPVKTQQVILDTIPPTTVRTINGPKHLGTYTYITSDSVLELTPSDSGVGPDYSEYYIDSGSWITYSTGFKLGTSYSDGLHRIYFRSIDLLGNTETIKTYLVYLDNTPPTITVNKGIPQYGTTPLWVNSSTPVEIVLTDAGSGPDSSEYRIDSGGWTTYTGQFNIPGDENDAAKPVVVSYKGYDNLGNLASKTESYLLDNKPPESTLTIGDPKYIDSGTVYVTSSTEMSISSTDNGGVGIEDIWYRLDYTTWTVYTGTPVTISGSDGVHTLEYYSIDYLGNKEETNSITVVLDNTPPAVEVTSPSDGGYLYGEITLEIEATDDGSGVNQVEYSVDDGATWLTASPDVDDKWTATWDTTTATEGAHTVLARADDNLGNIGYDEAPPTYTIVYLSYETSFTDSKYNLLTELIVRIIGQKKDTYKIATNPGTVMQWITITNTGTIVTLPEIRLDVMVPVEDSVLGSGVPAYMTQGAKAVKIFLNGVDVTPGGKWLPSLDCVETNQPLAPGDTITVIVHYEFAFKNQVYDAPTITTWPGACYEFETDILDIYGPNWIGYLTATPLL